MSVRWKNIKIPATLNETNYAPGISALKPRRVRMATSLTVEIISEVVLRGFLIRIKYKERGMMRLARPSSAWDTRRSAQCSLARGRRRDATAPRNKLNYLRDVSHCPSSPIIQRRPAADLDCWLRPKLCTPHAHTADHNNEPQSHN